ncbi:bifunctional diaminohydroxyphosphoribosylaminopyrimidine deaminase/5-amino-6-(5-phosphoribosylamino)uracil reductase RibD [Gorillibacterium sp. sgz5001074]|uniref:bifunctional diaminohydroxyphosphoribosylaminopyrimidine deaminase/5-amino-6-(5-phosphoribosylamino)uracil reductase RibD n=1 Tax=Gorillibacterium sp. sgz5001074 TaxID=3446695 RepID=UPI003F6764FA
MGDDRTKLNDETYMRLALELAAGALGQTGINPAVGCVIVKDGRIVGMGAHLKRGEAHAEIHALRMAGPEAEGATVYVTLEPCSHHGRTPPCADRLVQERVGRVVVACTDPNPQVAGRGILRLKEAGIPVDTGCLEQESRDLNEVFNHYILTRTPFVTVKTASTLDGKIASRTGDSKWISGEASRAYVHTLRHRSQAIMVGVETVLADDPSLTTRLTVPGLNPIPVIADSSLRIPDTAQVLSRPGAILLTTYDAPKEKIRRLEEQGHTVLLTGFGPRVDLREAMRLLGEREISSILLEGGGRLNGAMLAEGLIQKVILFLAPKIIGGMGAPGSFTFDGFDRMQEAIRLGRLRTESFGDDICITGYPLYGEEG